ncbi:MAG: ABC transporter permease, partial [Deinococcus sp.]
MAEPQTGTGGRRRRPDGSLWLGALLVGLVALAALLSFLWLPADPNAGDLMTRLQPSTQAHLLGTDAFGRDLLARVMVGARSALAVGLVAVGVGLGLGLPLGLIAGYAGGWPDRALTLLLDSLYVFPTLLLVMLLVTAWGAGLLPAMLAVGVSAVPVFARLARAGALSVRSEPYIEAALALGAAESRILWRHLLPNILTPLLVQASFTLGAAILIEGALSYLGLGIQPPQASWGNMLREAQSFLYYS